MNIDRGLMWYVGPAIGVVIGLAIVVLLAYDEAYNRILRACQRLGWVEVPSMKEASR